MRPELAPAFEAVILRAMALDPDARFDSVRALGAALLPFASERTRVLYTDTLHSVDGIVAPPLPPPPPPFSADPKNVTVTLGEAPLEVPAPKHTSAQVRVLSGLLAGVAALRAALSPRAEPASA